MQGQIESERRAFSGAVAVRGQSAAQLPGRQGAAMKAKAMAPFAGGEAVVENARLVFRRDANSVVNHRNFDPAVVF